MGGIVAPDKGPDYSLAAHCVRLGARERTRAWVRRRRCGRRFSHGAAEARRRSRWRAGTAVRRRAIGGARRWCRNRGEHDAREGVSRFKATLSLRPPFVALCLCVRTGLSAQPRGRAGRHKWRRRRAVGHDALVLAPVPRERLRVERRAVLQRDRVGRRGQPHAEVAGRVVDPRDAVVGPGLLRQRPAQRHRRHPPPPRVGERRHALPALGQAGDALQRIKGRRCGPVRGVARRLSVAGADGRLSVIRRDTCGDSGRH